MIPSWSPTQKEPVQFLSKPSTEPLSLLQPLYKGSGTLSLLRMILTLRLDLQQEFKIFQEESKAVMSYEMNKQIEMISEVGDIHAAQGDFTQAIMHYNKILEVDPANVSTWTSLGHCYSMINENFNALKAYQKAMSFSDEKSRDEQLWYGIGLLYEKVEDYQNAELAFRNGMSNCTHNTLSGEFCYHLGYILKAKTEYDEAIKVLINAILVGKFPTPKTVEILCTVGRCFEEKNNFQEALKTYRHALSLDESNHFTQEFIGWLYFQTESPSEALKYLQNEKSQAMDDEGELSYMLARCHLKMKNFTLAYELFQRCLNKKPYVSFYWSSFGILFAEINQHKQAFEAFNQALKLNPNMAENFYNLGCLYELSGQKSDAVPYYDKALGLQPSFTLAAIRKNQILYQLSQLQAQEVVFKHPMFKLSHLKLQMKEKLDKSFTNIYQSNKNVSVSLNPGVLGLLQSQKDVSSLSINNGIQHQSLAYQIGATAQSSQAHQLQLQQLQQQQQIQAMLPKAVPAHAVTQPYLQNPFGSIIHQTPLQQIPGNPLIPSFGTNIQPEQYKTMPIQQLGMPTGGVGFQPFHVLPQMNNTSSPFLGLQTGQQKNQQLQIPMLGQNPQVFPLNTFTMGTAPTIQRIPPSLPLSMPEARVINAPLKENLLYQTIPVPQLQSNSFDLINNGRMFQIQEQQKIPQSNHTMPLIALSENPALMHSFQLEQLKAQGQALKSFDLKLGSELLTQAQMVNKDLLQNEREKMNTIFQKVQNSASAGLLIGRKSSSDDRLSEENKAVVDAVLKNVRRIQSLKDQGGSKEDFKEVSVKKVKQEPVVVTKIEECSGVTSSEGQGQSMTPISDHSGNLKPET